MLVIFFFHLSEDCGVMKVIRVIFSTSDHTVSEKFYYNKYKLVYCKRFIFTQSEFVLFSAGVQ